MANKMLIDAAHQEETRVVVVRGNRIEEFDFESANRKQLRGNIYLAKVIRVEPSLQAAFVEYGGNRHGFLAFSEIHPDYYQIPLADRQALIEEEERERESEESEPAAEQRSRSRRNRRDRGRARSARPDETVTEELPADAAAASESADADNDNTGEIGESEATAHGAASDESAPGDTSEAPAENAAEVTASAEGSTEQQAEAGSVVETSEDAASETAPGEQDDQDSGASDDGSDDDEDESDDDAENGDEKEVIESVGGDDEALEEVPERRQPRRTRQYKIQEVIKRRQVLLVQAVKEERGNKGAALTTYLSLAGRYSVLMPNTARGGGISRKVTNAADRKKMKEIAGDLDVPEGMGVILRTAGANRTKPEIKRDFEYLLRLWETVRETTLQSTAPSLVHEEGSLVKRAIRDLYNKDIDEVQVAGDTAFREAKDFMRMLMPSHAKNVRQYRDAVPIFTKFGVEAQLDAMFSATVTLKSGGYLVINQTEALVAIDVNSGRSTREQNIEDTAVRTNLEAAEEVARQLRLRDLAGLIVVDFIDMEENRNNRSVEKKLKDCLKDDRARIQVGRISHFGLLEMSRQRIRTGVLESSSETCPVCAGAGRVRSVPSVALHVLRMIEDNLLRNQGYNLVVRTASVVALYIFNQKRGHLRDIEERFGIQVEFAADDHLSVHEHCVIQRGEPALNPRPVQLPPPIEDEDDDIVEEASDEAEEVSAVDDAGGDRAAQDGAENGDGNGRRKRRRRRRGRGERSDAPRDAQADGDEAEAAETSSGTVVTETETGVDIIPAEADSSTAASVTDETDEDAAPRSRRRGRRGGRRSRGASGTEDSAGSEAETSAPAEIAEQPSDSTVEFQTGDQQPAAEASEPAAAVEDPVAPEPEAIRQDAEPEATKQEAEPEVAAAEAEPEDQPAASRRPAPQSTELEPDRPRRSGWWNRLRG
jgi:ribonuclease E